MGKVDVEQDGGVAVITIDNLPLKNALDTKMGEQLQAVCDEIDGNETVGAAVLRGAGGRRR